jgi:hypothetical protein
MSGSLGRLVAAFCCALALPVGAQAQGLKFFKNYFHTGGHYAQGVSLRGTGTGGFAEATITIAEDASGAAGLPENADVLVALLYWETVTSTSGNGTAGAEFNGHSISAAAKLLNPSGTPPCWSNGGATGGGSNAHQMKAYRADVAPFIPPDPTTGKRKYIGTHTIKLPDVGVGNVVPSTAGATLLFIYSVPGSQTLRSTVVYDGGVTVNQTNPTFALTVSGWYQASKSSPNAYMTQVVGNGQTNFGEVVTFDGGAAIDTFTNPYTGQSGTLPVQPGVWDTFTAPVTLKTGTDPATSAIVTTSRGSGNGSFDCLSWGAIILTTAVEDNEKDNIVDVLESSSTSGQITDPNTGEKVPDLYAMGARTWNRDILIEIGFLKSTGGYGPNALGQTIAANHTHLPDRAALDMVTTAFNAQGFKLHIDAGNHYPKDWTAANWTKCFQQTNPTWTVDCAIIPAIVPGTGTGNPNTNPPIPLADGGEYIEETACSPSAQTSCLFEAYPGPVQCGSPQLNFACRFTGVPGTVVWKSGFRYYRDEPLTHRKTKTEGTFTVDDGPNEAACIIAETDNNAGTVCKRRFARNRHDWFRYSLWVHATGIPRDPPNQASPRNVSGIGDFLGADHQVSLGLWDFATGTTFTQASTFMHELGHGLGLRHGGITGEPNCKPNYQSVMNYLFQIRGLINNLGVAEIGYSNQILKALNENNLNESLGLTTAAVEGKQVGDQPMQWRTRWYTDWQTSFIDNAGGLSITPVAKRCNGAPKANELMARVDGTSTTGGIDWNANGTITGAVSPPETSDLNFSGLPLNNLAVGSNDWQNLNLQTIGSRRNVGGWSVESGYWDTGYWDTGADTGYWDTGYWDTGAPGDYDFTQSGYWDTGYWDTGYWDTGYWDTGAESESALVPKGEVDLDTAASIGNAPNAVKAAIPAGGKDPVVSWLPPHVKADKVGSYEVYRVEGASSTMTITPTNFLNRVTINNNVPANQLSVTDTTAKNNVWYIYIVLAQFTEISPITGEAVRSGIAQSVPFRK